jgi:hypothetical protein
MVQVHLTIDLEGVSDPKIIELMTKVHDKMHPYGNKWIRFHGLLIFASLQKTRDRA